MSACATPENTHTQQYDGARPREGNEGGLELFRLNAVMLFLNYIRIGLETAQHDPLPPPHQHDRLLHYGFS